MKRGVVVKACRSVQETAKRRGTPVRRVSQYTLERKDPRRETIGQIPGDSAKRSQAGEEQVLA